MPDYTGDTHDTLVVLRAHIRHLPLTCLYFRVADEQAFIVLLTAFAAYRDRRQYFHTRLHLGKHTSAVLLWSFSFGVISFSIFKSDLHVVSCTVR